MVGCSPKMVWRRRVWIAGLQDRTLVDACMVLQNVDRVFMKLEIAGHDTELCDILAMK